MTKLSRLSVAFIVSFCAACSKSAAPGAPPPMPVEAITLVTKPVEQTTEFVGTVKSRRSTTVQPQVEGFITRILARSGDRVHAIWADEYLTAMLHAGVPNMEMHIYGNGRHPGEQLNDGGRMTGGLSYRNGMPFGTWQDRFMDWFRDLGFLQKPGMETKAARDVAASLNRPQRGAEPRNPGKQ